MEFQWPSVPIYMDFVRSGRSARFARSGRSVRSGRSFQWHFNGNQWNSMEISMGGPRALLIRKAGQTPGGPRGPPGGGGGAGPLKIH